MHGSWTKCWVFFSIFFNLPPPPSLPSASVLPSVLHTIRCSILHGAPYYMVLHTIRCSILYGAPFGRTHKVDIYFGHLFRTFFCHVQIRQTDRQTDRHINTVRTSLKIEMNKRKSCFLFLLFP